MEREERQRVKDVHLVNFYICYGENVLISDADLFIAHDKRYGLVGRNGEGKSTFLKMLSTKKLKIPKHRTSIFRKTRGNL